MPEPKQVPIRLQNLWTIANRMNENGKQQNQRENYAVHANVEESLKHFNNTMQRHRRKIKITRQ